MDRARIYNIREHYLLEIDDVFTNGDNGKIYKTWSWEIFIADNGKEEYKGMAIERSKNELIPWTTLREHEYNNEIHKLCQMRMNERI